MERRKARRISHRLACEFDVEDRTHRGFILNLSREGAYLQTELALSPGSELSLRIEGPGFPECELLARVAPRILVPGPRSKTVRKGIGLALIDPPALYWEAFNQLENEEEPAALEDTLAPDPEFAPESARGAEAEATVMEFSQEEWEALGPLEEQNVTGKVGASVLSVDTLLIGEGEVDDVAILLSELGVEVVRVNASESHGLSCLAVPPRVIIASARSALEIRLDDLRRGGEPTTLAVAEGESIQLVDMLRRRGFDFVVRRPVDVDALRLLLARLTFRGAERRVHPRTPIRCEVKLHSGRLMVRRYTQGYASRFGILTPVGYHELIGWGGQAVKYEPARSRGAGGKAWHINLEGAVTTDTLGRGLRTPKILREFEVRFLEVLNLLRDRLRLLEPLLADPRSIGRAVDARQGTAVHAQDDDGNRRRSTRRERPLQQQRGPVV